jgi:hypothetical protein
VSGLRTPFGWAKKTARESKIELQKIWTAARSRGVNATSDEDAMSSDDLPPPYMLVHRAASCLASCITDPDGDLRLEYEQQLRQCFSLAKDGAAGILWTNLNAK